MRGATPLDVAAASVMDNNELALALREPDLEKVSLHPPAFYYSADVVVLHSVYKYSGVSSMWLYHKAFC